ncbi:hypothetical protein ACTMU2_11320 [Cupriavidus basilensis]
MNAPQFPDQAVSPQFRAEALRIDGQKVMRERVIEVRNPYDGIACRHRAQGHGGRCAPRL